MTQEEILHDLEWYTAESIAAKYTKDELLKAIEVERERISKNEQAFVKKNIDAGMKYYTAINYARKNFKKSWDRYNKKASDIKNILEGKPTEAMIKTVRSKIVAIVKKHKFPVQKTHTTRIRGWTETSSGSGFLQSRHIIHTNM